MLVSLISGSIGATRIELLSNLTTKKKESEDVFWKFFPASEEA